MQQKILLPLGVILILLVGGYILSDIDVNDESEQLLLKQADVVYVEDQKITDAKVRIGFAILSHEGFVGIHQDKDGQVGALVGISRTMPQGAYEKLIITLDKPVVAGEAMWAVLYRSDQDGVITFLPGKDEPFKDKDGNNISMQFRALEKDPDFSDVAL